MKTENKINNETKFRLSEKRYGLAMHPEELKGGKKTRK